MRNIGGLADALGDRYQFERELGQGGAAQVYLATDLKLQRAVAIKVLRRELTASVAADRFVREIRIEAGLEHPNIVSLHDAGTVDGLLYFVMTYVNGGTLRDHMRQRWQLPVTEALQITCEVAGALEHAHRHGFLHRDIKPENILRSDEHWLVADFGIACAISSTLQSDRVSGERLTLPGIVLGTPEYMSPEQVTGGSLDERSDAYSLACVLFEMLAGTPPFTGLTTHAVASKQLNDPPPSIRAVRSEIPVSIALTLQRALAKAPADRYQSIAELRDALEVCDDVTASARRGRPRSLLRSGALAVGAAVLSVLAVIGLWPPSLGPPLDSSRVLVFPMRESNLQVLASDFSGRMAALRIGTALEYVEPLKFDWGETWLPPAIRDDIAGLDAKTGNDIARERGAAYWIEGEIVEQSPLASVTLWLHDLKTGVTEQHTEHGYAHPDSLAGLALRAGFVLVQTIVQVDVDRDAFAGGDLAASALWMQGESEYRRARFASALTFYRRAVTADSTLALAALRGAQSASWSYDLDDARQLVQVAVHNGATLPERYRHFARGLSHYYAGAADSAVRDLRLALDLDPAWTDAWMALGEVYTHLLPRAAPLDSLAEVAFTTARRLDPGFSPPLFHLLEMALRQGDVSRATSLLRAFRATGPDSVLERTASIMFICVIQGAKAVPWLRHVRASPRAVFDAATGLSPRAAQPACAEAGWRATLEFDRGDDAWARNRRWSAVLGLQSLFLAQGRDDEALELLSADPEPHWATAAKLTLLLDVVAGASYAEHAAMAASDIGRADLAALSSARLWFLGVWAGHTGDVETIERVADRLATRAARSGAAYEGMLARSVEAQAALATGDSARALALLDAVYPTVRDGIAWWPFISLPVARLREAELQLAAGRYRDAYATASVFDAPTPVIYLAFLPASLELRLRAAELLRDRDLADRMRRRLAALEPS